MRDDVGAYNVHLSAYNVHLKVIHRLSFYAQDCKVHAIVMHRLLVLYKSHNCGQLALALWTTSSKGLA